MGKPEHAGGPVDRLDLLGAIIDDERARMIHAKVAKHILARYYQKFGNARASVSFLQEATKLTRGSVAQATEDLVSWGYFTRTMGSGKRPTEYHPNFSVLWSPDDTSVLASPDATESTVPQPQDERVLQSRDAKSSSVPQPQDQTQLRNAFTNAVTLTERSSSAPCTGAGLAATPARADIVVELTVVRIRAEVIDRNCRIVCEFADEDGGEYDDAFWAEHRNSDQQAAGQKRLHELMNALDINEFADLEQYNGRRLAARYDDGDLEYVSAEVARRMAA